jgi:assimilatory nitrate reductase catalytic subunit
VLRRRRAIDPPSGTRSELWIMNRLAELLDAPSKFPTEPEAVFEELRTASAGGLADYSGVSYGLLDSGAEAYWPFPLGSRGTPRLFRQRFAHEDGRARLVAVRAASSRWSASSPALEEFQLATGRLLEHYQSGAQTRRVGALAAAQPEPRLQLHPAAAARLRIADGAWVRVTRSQSGEGQPASQPEVLCRVELTLDIRPDTVFLPFHFPGLAAANQVTEGRTDPISGMPEFKTTRVLVQPARIPPTDAELVPSAPREERL